MKCPDCNNSLITSKIGQVCLECERIVSRGRLGRLLDSVAPRKWSILAATLVSLILLGGAGWLVSYLHQPVKLVYSLADVKVNNPITISFSRPIRDHVNYNISPSLSGNWQVSRDLFGITALKFYPSQPLVPGSSYQLILGNVTPLIASQPTILARSLPVAVEKPAGIAAITPGSAAGNVSVGTSISVRLASPNRGLRRLVLTSDASLASPNPTSTDDTTFVWKLAKPLQQGTTYHLTLTDAKQTGASGKVLAETTFTTVPEPQVVSATTTDHFYPGSAITIAFDQDMKPLTSDFRFGFAGSGHWQDARTYVFTPSGLSPGTSYSYAVLQGAVSAAGGVTDTNQTFSISPPGAAYVMGSSPGGSNVGVSTPVSFTFDQPVDHTSAQAAFGISPSAPGSFSWSGNTMTFHPSGLSYQTGYIATVAPGVKGVYGLASTRSFSDSFSTTYQVIKLAVPYYRQAYALSCEEASLRMALAYRGINVNDYDILMKLNYNPEPRNQSTNYWDNPYQMFVGDVNGQEGVTGWGVYGPPIAAAAQSFGRNATYVSGITAGQIVQAIEGNNPVVLWGFSGSSVQMDSWNTSSGVVQAPKNEHARTVYGVAGNPSNPIGFYIHDPYYGDLYWTTAQLEWNMDWGGAMPSQGVIVY
jgi:uncharacterized protein YvpB